MPHKQKKKTMKKARMSWRRETKIQIQKNGKGDKQIAKFYYTAKMTLYLVVSPFFSQESKYAIIVGEKQSATAKNAFTEGKNEIFTYIQPTGSQAWLVLSFPLQKHNSIPLLPLLF